MLKQRLAAALVLIPAFIAALFLLSPLLWKGLVLCLVAIAAWEWARLCRLDGHRQGIYSVAIPICSAMLLYLGEQWNIVMPLSILIFVFWLCLVPLWLMRAWSKRNQFLLMLTGGMVLIPTAVAFVNLRVMSPAFVLMLMGLVWVADSAAYFAGHRWGRHKLAPSISPGKTWEGAIGAVIASMAYLLIWQYTKIDLGLTVASLTGLNWILLGVFMVSVSILGDLFESHMKRNAGVKDSGNLIPGHGGLLDRIDSQTSIFPMVMALIYLTGMRGQ